MVREFPDGISGSGDRERRERALDGPGEREAVPSDAQAAGESSSEEVEEEPAAHGGPAEEEASAAARGRESHAEPGDDEGEEDIPEGVKSTGGAGADERREDPEDAERDGPGARGAWEEDDFPLELPRLRPPRRRGRRLVKKPELPREAHTPRQRLLLLDTWRRSGLPAGDFAALVGISKHTLYGWRKRFQEHGPAGLEDRPRGGPRGSRVAEVTRRAIVLMKETHPDWGCQRISDMLFRGPALPASASTVARVLHEAGYELEDVPARRHPQAPRRFERSRPNQLWQSDLFTFVLKRQNRRVYLVAFLDDHSRFVTGWGVHSTQSSALVLEVLRSAVTNYNPPEEILTDNGSQYVTWRGRSAFTKELSQRGIRHVVSSPRRPQTLGKVERFWGSVWREFLEAAIFTDLDDARRRVGYYIDHYNFRRPHQAIDGLTPADRFFSAAPKVLEMLRRRVEENALELARHGVPKRPFYLTGQVGGKPFSVHAEGERLIVQHDDREREEVEPVAPERSPEEPVTEEAHPDDHPGDDEERAPGTSPLDGLFEHRDDESKEGGES